MKERVADTYLFNLVDNDFYILTVKRGAGARSYPGKWCIPGGHIETNESTSAAARRELYEETGILISLPDKPSIVHIDNRFEVNMFVEIRHEIFKKPVVTHSEKNEIEDVKFIPIKDIGKYEWAFPGQIEKLNNIINIYSLK